MAIQFPIPQGLNEKWAGGRKWLVDALGNIFDPNQNASPPNIQGMEVGPMPGPPQSLPDMMASMAMPETPKAAYESGIMGMGPMPAELAQNYRTPEAIAALRKAMAAENRVRGPMAEGLFQKAPASQYIAEPEKYFTEGFTPSQNDINQLRQAMGIPLEGSLTTSPDPVDQILRGSWFHGMRPEARAELMKMEPSISAIAPPEIKNQGIDPYALFKANIAGLPGSTHATPSYTRFGEPYGVSISASPSIAKNFSADDYIHRVQPLYGGPPSEAIIPMWRPEGQKVMNEGYNAAFNEILGQGVTIADLNKMQHLGIPTGYIQPGEPFLKALKGPFETATLMNQPLEQKISKLGESMAASTPITGEFNTLYSQALQKMGKRGILYSPQRYGEYEMLMLDPSFVRPLDYRKVTDYIPRYAKENPGGLGNISFLDEYGGVKGATPGSRQGYTAAQPEFETGATRLSDVFNQVPWVDRINEENKRRIAEMIDAQYREQVINQLFGNR